MTDWRGKLFLHEASLLYAGAVAPTDVHQHHAWQVLVALDAPVVLRGRDEQFEIETHAAAVGPNVPHGIVRGSPAVVLFFFDVEGREARDGAAFVGTSPDPTQWVDAANRIGDRLPTTLPRSREDAHRATAAILGAVSEARSRARSIHPAVARARQYVEANLHGDLRARAVAEAAGLSASRLAQVFAADVGLPLRAFVRWCRLRAAGRALESGLTLSAAAAAAGFADGAHLTRTFKAMFGIAPSQVTAVAQWVVGGGGRV